MNHSRSCVSISRAQQFQQRCQRATGLSLVGVTPIPSRSYTVASRSGAQRCFSRHRGTQPIRPNGISHHRPTTYIQSSQRLASTVTERPSTINPSSPAPSDTFPPDSLEGLEERDPSAIPTDLLASPIDDHVGFLAENYGLDFGWGTSSMMKFAFENIHLFSGFEFWGSIVATGLFARLLCIPFIRISSDNMAKMGALTKVMAPLQAKMKAAGQSGNQLEMQKTRNELKEVYKRTGVRPWKMILAFVQMPISFGCWRTFSNMAAMPVSGMTTGGFLWFTNLTIPDPLFIVPVLTCAMQWVSGKYNSESNAATIDPAQQKTQKILMNVLPVIFLPFIAIAPAAVQLHFLTTATFATITNFSLRNNTIRGLIRMAPRVSKADAPPASSYTGTINVAARSRPTSNPSPGPGPAASKTTPEPAAPPPSYNPITRMRYAAGRLQTSLKSTTDAITPDILRSARKKRADPAAKYEARRRQEIAREKVAYEQQLERMRLNRKR